MKRILFPFAATAYSGSVIFPQVKSETELQFQKTEKNLKLLEKCKKYLKNFKPTPLLNNGHFQTVWNEFAPNKKTFEHLKFDRQLVKMGDGSTISIDYMVRENSDVVVVLFPGLTGGTDKDYVQAFCDDIYGRAGFSLAIFHAQGIAQTEYTSADPFLHNLTSDKEAQKTFEEVQKKFGKNKRYFGVGLSMGGNILMRTAGKMGKNLPLEGIVVWNTPFDLKLAINLMRDTVYEKYFVADFIKYLLFREGALGQRERPVVEAFIKKFKLNEEVLKKMSTWNEFDREIVRKVYKRDFQPVNRFYEEASALQQIKGVCVPTLVVHSRDDPVISFQCCPVSECVANPNIIVCTTKVGGHVCYFQGIWARDRWYPKVSEEFIRAIIATC